MFFPRFSRRCRSLEQNILKQGIPAPDAPSAGPKKLLPAVQKGPTLYSGSLAEPHLFVLPPNTAGEATLKKRPQPQGISQASTSCQGFPLIKPAPPVSFPFTSLGLPIVPGPSQVVFFNPPNISLPSAIPPSTSSQDVPYSTQQYRKRKEEMEKTGTVKRKYKKKTDVVLCRKCKKDRKPPSHQQYFGNWFCQETDTQSFDEWRAILKEAYKKKKPE